MMGKLSSKLRSLQDGGIAFWCPACKGLHQIGVGEGVGPRWGYNDNPDAPTFIPSIRVQGVVPLTDEQHAAWVRGGGLPEPVPFTCHSFITDGQIQFCEDSTHEMAGRTVALPDLPEGGA